MYKINKPKIASKHNHFGYFLASSCLWPRLIPQFTQYFFLWAANLQYLAILLWWQLCLVSSNVDDIFSNALFKLSKLLTLKSLIVSETSNFIISGLILAVWVYFIVIFCTLL